MECVRGESLSYVGVFLSFFCSFCDSLVCDEWWTVKEVVVLNKIVSRIIFIWCDWARDGDARSVIGCWVVFGSLLCGVFGRFGLKCRQMRERAEARVRQRETQSTKKSEKSKNREN